MTSTSPRGAAAEARTGGASRTGHTIVDTNIHPHAPAVALLPRLEVQHRRRWEMFGSPVPGPPEIYPRVRNSGFRLDGWPETGVPGSDLRMAQDQLLDEYGVDYGLLIPLQGHSWGTAPRRSALRRAQRLAG